MWMFFPAGWHTEGKVKEQEKRAIEKNHSSEKTCKDIEDREASML